VPVFLFRRLFHNLNLTYANSMKQFKMSLQVPVPVETLFAWHDRPGAFERLLPPWEPVRIKARQGSIRDGDWLHLQMGPMSWLARHRGYQPPHQFIDIQAQGPLAYWQHQHLFRALSPERSELTDLIEYELPLAPASGLAHPWTQARLHKMFTYRHRITAQDLAFHATYSQGRSPMKILITGASGLLGSSLSAFLSTGGHTVLQLVRRPSTDPLQICWDARQQIDSAALEGLDAVIHLAGESLATGRWSPAKKERILQSRVQGTRLLVQSLKALQQPPKVLICASATGYYGSRGEHILDETSAAGSGFLAEVCQAWEAEADKLQGSGIRLVKARFGVVLSAKGGALPLMLPPFQLGLGGKLGSGQQYLSWIASEDLIRGLYHCLYHAELSGPVNFTAPQPLKNIEFTRLLAQALKRPAVFAVPSLALKLALGEMADEMLLSSTRALPTKLLETGFTFLYPELPGALQDLLGV